MVHWIQPRPRPGIRLAVFAILVALLAISPGRLPAKGVGLVTIAFLTGSYRRALVEEEKLETQLVICFYPLRKRRVALRKFSRIEVAIEEPSGWWVFFLFGPIQWLWNRILDHVFPWFSGIYQIRLAAPNRSILVWQGCSDEVYEQNLELLRGLTGLEIARGADT